MEPRLVVLQLFLQELNIPLTIGSIDDRLLIQKGVYLGQRAGADLNYRFSWYLKGPYCSDLTKDYYKIGENVDGPTKAQENFALRNEYVEELKGIKTLLEVPGDIDLTRSKWVELLASLDYAENVQKLGKQKAIDFVAREKPLLASFIPAGIAALQASPLHG